jgi:hypothetical protein
MNIILGREPAEKLKENYTVLELETFEHNGEKVTAFCVVNQVPVMELPSLEQHKKLHETFIAEYNAGNYSFCKDVVEHLIGRFGGELDSFYQTLLDKIAS